MTRPIDETDQLLISAWEDRGENQSFELPPDTADYERLVDLIFDADITITW